MESSDCTLVGKPLTHCMYTLQIWNRMKHRLVSRVAGAIGMGTKLPFYVTVGYSTCVGR